MRIIPFFVSGFYSCSLFQKIFDDGHVVEGRCDQNRCLVMVVCAINQCLVLIFNKQETSSWKNVSVEEYKFLYRILTILKNYTAINILTISRCPMVQAVCNGYTLDMLQWFTSDSYSSRWWVISADPPSTASNKGVLPS